MKKLTTSINFSNKAQLSMKSFFRSIAVLFTLALLSGCAGLIIDSIDKSMATDKTYGEMAATLPPLTDGRGRLYIYRTEASTKTSIQYGYGLKKNATFCTIDDTAYELIWEVFRYIDLPEGHHEVTCGDDVLREVDFWSKGRFLRGKNKIQVSVSNSSEIFIKVETIKEFPFFQPILVNAEQGREEMLKLPYQKGVFKIAGGKISSSESK